MVAWLVAPFLFAAACGGKSDGDDDEGPTFLEEPSFRQLFASQLCSMIANCCNRISAPINETNCRLQATEAVNELTEDGVVYDGAAAAACLNAYTSALQHCAVPGEGSLGACDVVYVGTIPPGGACTTSAQCAGRDAYCEPDLSGGQVCVDYSSTAVPLEPAVQGEACAGSCSGSPDGADSEPCLAVGPGPNSTSKVCYESDGLYCDFTTQACVPSPGLGELCSYYCATGLYCDFTSGQCATALADGQPCEYYEECSSRRCGDGLCGQSEMIGVDICSNF